MDTPRITEMDLRPGDVLLSRGDSDISLGIVELDGGSYSHAGIWCGDTAIESTLPCVRESSLAECSGHSLYIDAYRFRSDVPRPDSIVACARAYLGRPYGVVDLGLSTLLLAVSSWMPDDWAEMNALYGAAQLRRMLRLLQLIKDEDADERVTCVELVVRAYFNAGVPITVTLSGNRRFKGRSFVAALREIAGRLRESERARRAGFTFDDAHPLPHRPLEQELRWLASVNELEGDVPGRERDDATWRPLRAEWNARFGLGEPATAETTTPRLPADAIRSKKLLAGQHWPPGLVTPRQLETAPDLERVGRLCEK